MSRKCDDRRGPDGLALRARGCGCPGSDPVKWSRLPAFDRGYPPEKSPMLRPPRVATVAALALVLPLLIGCTAPVSWGGGPAGIYVVGVDGSGLTRLVDVPAQAAWAPASDRLAYTAEDGVWLVGADGTGRTRLAEARGAGPPAWSPDGARIAFVDPSAQRLRLVAVDGSGETAIPLLAEDPGDELVAFAIDAPPAWSPDGARIAVVSWDGNGDELYAVETAGGGGKLAQLSDIPAGTRPVNRADPRGQRIAVAMVGYPAWSPDGSRIAFARYPEAPGSGGGVYLVDGAGVEPERLTRVVPLTGARWSPDGRKLLFAARREENDDVYVVNLRGFGLLSNLTRTHAGRSRDPVWSPDGRRIAFASDGDLWLMNADGSGKRPVAATELRDFAPAWSPDGTRLAFASEPEIGGL